MESMKKGGAPWYSSINLKSTKKKTGGLLLRGKGKPNEVRREKGLWGVKRL